MRLGRESERRVFELFGVFIAVIIPGDAGYGFSLIEEETPPGLGPPLHRHLNEDEFFRVIEGRYRFYCDGKTIDLGEGDVLAVPKGAPHAFMNIGAENARLFMGFTPGGPEAYFQAAAAAGHTASKSRGQEDAIAQIAHRYGVEFLGPSPLRK